MRATNKIILGTVQFGLDYGINNTVGKPDPEVVFTILETAYNSGIQMLDTAESYGTAHEVIGMFHMAHPSKIFNVITKLPHYIDGKIVEKVERYFRELNIDKLHGLLFHSFESYNQNVTAISFLKDLKKNNQIENIGVSVYTNLQMEEVIRDKDIDIIQLPYNLFDNINQRGELIARAKKSGKIIHTRSAFLQGLFFSDFQSENKIIKGLKNELRYLRKLSVDYDTPIQKLALNYCLQQKNIDQILMGVDTLSQLAQNLTDADFSLSEELIKKIDAINVEDHKLLNPSLWNQ